MTRPALRRCCLVAWALLLLLTPAAAQNAEQELAEARRLLSTGKYAEAQDAYQALAAAEPVAAALGAAECLIGTGKLEEAAATLATSIGEHPEAAPLHAAAARLAFDRGDYEAARQGVEAALAIDADLLAARWIQAELWRTAGELDKADQACKWFVDYYNAHEVTSAESLRWIGLAAAQFARWNRLSDQFAFFVNELYPDALELDKEYWPAHYESGLLFLEKYNQAEASRAFAAALKLNPNAAPVYAALARLALQNFEVDDATRALDRALAINPALAEAHRGRGDVQLTNLDAAKAVEAFEKALAVNPASEASLGRLAAALVLLEGPAAAEPGGRAGKLVEQATARNPHAGEFFYSMGEGLELSRRFPAAARYYREALARMPRLTAPRGALGLMAMRLGDEAEAKRLLDESHEIDPFNVRVSNSLKVLEVLDGYAVLETDHFVIKFDRVADELLARYAARYLEEEVYPELVAQFGFEPQGKSLFEFFCRARNTSGHGWFSARMVGLPYVGTVGACAGKIVALASPNDMPKKYNWARVLKHEFVHVLNLQQTEFNIPHWFTEALAVESEGYPRPQTWNDLLSQRVPRGELFNLETINLGFIRPKSSLDWQMAYCQAQLYVQYMKAAHGADAAARLLQAYQANLDTRSALKKSFGVEQEAFEQGYAEHLAQVVQGLASRPKPAPMTLAELERARAADPQNAEILARLAQAHLLRQAYPEARKLARQAIAGEPKHQLAHYVLARIHLVVGETAEAMDLLAGSLDPDDPDESALNLLAGLKFKAKDYDEAGRLYELGAKSQPSNIQWTKSLARLYLSTGEEQKLAAVLEQLAMTEADDAAYRKKLAQLALKAKDFESAARWARLANHIDVMDAEVHRMWAEALSGMGEHGESAEEYEVAARLKPDELGLRLACAAAWIEAKQPEKARAVLEKLLQLDADYPGAEAMLESVSP